MKEIMETINKQLPFLKKGNFVRRIIFVKDALNKEIPIRTKLSTIIINDCVTGDDMHKTYYKEVYSYDVMEKSNLVQDFNELGDSVDFIFVEMGDNDEVNELKTKEDLNRVYSKEHTSKLLFETPDVRKLKRIDYSATKAFLEKRQSKLKDFIDAVSPEEFSIVVRRRLGGGKIFDVVSMHRTDVLGHVNLYCCDLGVESCIYTSSSFLLKDPTALTELDFSDKGTLAVVYGFTKLGRDYYKDAIGAVGTWDGIIEVASMYDEPSNTIIFGAVTLDSKHKKLYPDEFNADELRTLVNEAINLL